MEIFVDGWGMGGPPYLFILSQNLLAGQIVQDCAD